MTETIVEVASEPCPYCKGAVTIRGNGLRLWAHCYSCHMEFPVERGNRKELSSMDEFKEGEYIIYQNGDRYELGKIKRITPDGAFVWYHEGETAAKTPFDCMHKLVNGFTIKKTSLGGVVV